MKVVAAVNALVSSDIVAHYALRYAALFGHRPVLLHVENPADQRHEVEKSMAMAEETAAGLGLSCERIFLAGDPARAIQAYVGEHRTDALFCGAGLRRRIFADSLGGKLARLFLAADLAVVRVASADAVFRTAHMVLPIREDHLSVEKYVFFSSMARAFDAAAEIYSVTTLSRPRQAGLDPGATRALFQKCNDRLGHYGKNLRLLAVPFRIRHGLAGNEVDQILHHLAHHEFQLMIIGGARLSAFPSLLGEQPIERLFRQTPVNTIAFYPRQKKGH